MAILPKVIYRFNAIPIKIPMRFFTELQKKNSKIYRDQKKTQNCQNNPEEQKLSRRHNSPRPQAILQSCSYQDSMVLEPKQTYRPMEQNREPRNKHRHLWSINVQQRRQEDKMGKYSPFSKWCWENWTASCKSMKLEHTLTHAQK